jgi:hypothetical protein
MICLAAFGRLEISFGDNLNFPSCELGTFISSLLKLIKGKSCFNIVKGFRVFWMEKHLTNHKSELKDELKMPKYSFKK